ncbi:MAG: WD40 repeat domain-containing protein [Phycisphaerales bacterium JB043]
MRRIRHIATTRAGTRVAVGAYETRVAVWDIAQEEQISEFDTPLDGSSDNLAITPDGRFVVAGQYGAKGTGCYDAETGEAVWIHRELKRLGHASIAPDGKHAYLGFDEGSGRIIDMTSGETLEKLRGIREMAISPFGDAVVLGGQGQRIIRLDGGQTIAKLKRDDIFGCGFAPGLVCINGLRAFEPNDNTPWIRMRWCVDTASGEEIWRHEWTDPVSTFGGSYDEQENVFLALESKSGGGGPRTLARLDVETGQVIDRVLLPDVAWEIGFCSKGAELLCPDGTIVCTRSGEALRTLDFPDTSDANA